MLLVAIFAVGAVSATEDIAMEDNIIEHTDDIVIDDVSVEEEVESDNVIKEEQNLRYISDTVDPSMSSTTINEKIYNASTYYGGGDILFAPGNYTNMNLILKDNVNLIGNNSKLIGTGANTVITVDNCSNFKITGFTIDANYNSPANNISAIRGSYVNNGEIAGNTITNGYNGININKFYSNMNIHDNVISGMINDGVSLANPATLSNMSDVGYTYVSRNNISSCGYGIFIGGNFNGEIKNDKISDCTFGIEFAGKPKAGNGTLHAALSYLDITNCTNGINMYHPYAQYLLLDHVNFDQITGYDVYTNGNVNPAGFISVIYSSFCQGVKSAFYNAVDYNWGNTNFIIKP